MWICLWDDGCLKAAKYLGLTFRRVWTIPFSWTSRNRWESVSQIGLKMLILGYALVSGLLVGLAELCVDTLGSGKESTNPSSSYGGGPRHSEGLWDAVSLLTCPHCTSGHHREWGWWQVEIRTAKQKKPTRTHKKMAINILSGFMINYNKLI